MVADIHPQNVHSPSMKVPPKRKGNSEARELYTFIAALNESPSEKEGKYRRGPLAYARNISLNESPSEKEGKSALKRASLPALKPSMKVPPKRKGNLGQTLDGVLSAHTLNESPSEKEGKLMLLGALFFFVVAPQ